MLTKTRTVQLVKVLASRGEEDDDDKSSAKKKLMTRMAIMAATNYFESKHGS